MPRPSRSRSRALPFLRGRRIVLRPLEARDADGPYASWFNDPVVCSGNSHHVAPFTRQDALAYIKRARQATDELALAIVRRPNGRHIGNIALKRIHPVNRSAEFAIIIGDKRSWGKGYATETARLLLDHAFGAMNLYRIYCGTFESNHAMRRLAKTLGMREEGRRRQAAFKHGRFLDIVEYGVLREEYVKRRPLGRP